ncbi:MAG: GC-type dockerin domain-anchored protein [Phycisphaerales bacterium]|nr:GC-type dockerin domain-anchored protein [Phycisphaerales bacterium]
MPRTSKLLAVFLAAGSVSSVAHAQSWGSPADGNWFVAANWSPAAVPTGAGAVGTLGLAGPYTVTTTTNALLGLNIPNGQATLAINGGSWVTLVGSGPGVINSLNGQIVVNTSGAYAGTNLVIGAPSVTFSGTGSIRLNASASDPSTTVGTAYMYQTNSGSLVMNAGTALGGFGWVNGLPTTNSGTFTADISGRPLRIEGATHQNNNLYTASNGGTLTLVSTTVNQVGAGRIAPAAGSSAHLHTTVVNGGAVTSLPDARVVFVSGTSGLAGVTINGGMDQVGGVSTTLGASGMVLAGGATYTVNSSAAYAGTQFYVNTPNTPVNGTGTLRLNASPSDPGTTVQTAAVNAVPGGSLSIGSGVVLAGFGYVGAPTTNNGVFNADITGRPLRIDNNTHQNNSLYTATNGGTLVLATDTITQSPGAAITAVGASPDTTVPSNVQISNTTVIGGSISSNSAARVQVNPSTSAFLENVTLNGGLDCYGGSVVHIDSPGITLSGGATLLVNTVANSAGTRLVTGDAGTLIGGNGTVRLNASTSDPNTTVGTAAVGEDGGAAGGSFVFAPGVTLAGFGIVIDVPTVNNGVFSADTDTRQLRVQGSSHQNNNLYTAENGGTLVLVGTTVNQSGSARVTAGSGSTVYLNTSRINGGTIGSPAGGTGVALIDATEVVLDAVSISRQLNLSGGGTLTLPTSVTLTNNALVTINTAGSYAGTRVRADGTPTLLSGTGTFHLSASVSDSGTTVGTSDLARNGAIPGSGFTFGSGVTVDGFGRISDCPTTNNGNVKANVDGRPLRIDGNSHQNNNRYEAVNGGTLVLVGATVTQGPFGVINAGDGSSVSLNSGTTVNAGAFTAGGTGRFVVASASAIGGVVSGAPIDISGGSSLSVNAAGLTNNGLVTVNTNADYAGTAFYAAAPGAAIGGSGEVRLNRSVSDGSATIGTSDLRPTTAADSFSFGSGQTLSGSGRTTANVSMSGVISPGVGVGGVAFIRNESGATLSFTDNGRLRIDTASVGSFDRLVNAGAINLDGTLIVDSAFDAAPGTVFDVITGGTINGQFDTVLSSGLSAPKRFGARYDVPGRVRVTVLCGPADIAGQGADGNGDGVLNNNDFIVYIDRFFNSDPRADVGTQGGVPGSDGAFDNNDFIVFIDLFFAGCF